MSRTFVAPWVAPLSVVRALSRWPVDSQLHARRNALVASTAMAARAHERRQVDQYLNGHARRWAARQVPTRTTAPVSSLPAVPVVRRGESGRLGLRAAL